MKIAQELGYVMCHDCHSLNELKDGHCYRCNGQLFSRRPNSLSFAWAWLVTAAVMIVPANVFPITIINKFGVLEPDTIMSGVLSLIELGMVPIALIVFVASVLVPGVKLVGLFYIYLSVYLKPPISEHKITHMFHFIEWIGRWSMLDLFVISIMIVLLDVGQVSFEAGPATVAFGMVVVSTMLSAKAFDPRLLWDKLPSENNQNKK
jgi:paraquat-inducible protein A